MATALGRVYRRGCGIDDLLNLLGSLARAKTIADDPEGCTRWGGCTFLVLGAGMAILALVGIFTGGS